MNPVNVDLMSYACALFETIEFGIILKHQQDNHLNCVAKLNPYIKYERKVENLLKDIHILNDISFGALLFELFQKFDI